MSNFNTIIEHVSIDNGLIKVVALNYTSGMGWRCGYVGVPEGHPLYGKKYEKIENEFKVNGGLTYSSHNESYDKEAGVRSKHWYIGFDCAHAGDVLDEETKAKYNIPYNSDIFHDIDYKIWCYESVLNEVNYLANQTKEKQNEL